VIPAGATTGSLAIDLFLDKRTLTVTVRVVRHGTGLHYFGQRVSVTASWKTRTLFELETAFRTGASPLGIFEASASFSSAMANTPRYSIFTELPSYEI
jgi:hypothetical protein